MDNNNLGIIFTFHPFFITLFLCILHFCCCLLFSLFRSFVLVVSLVISAANIQALGILFTNAQCRCWAVKSCCCGALLSKVLNSGTNHFGKDVDRGTNHFGKDFDRGTNHFGKILIDGLIILERF